MCRKYNFVWHLGVRLSYGARRFMTLSGILRSFGARAADDVLVRPFVEPFGGTHPAGSRFPQGIEKAKTAHLGCLGFLVTLPGIEPGIAP